MRIAGSSMLARMQRERERERDLHWIMFVFTCLFFTFFIVFFISLLLLLPFFLFVYNVRVHDFVHPFFSFWGNREENGNWKQISSSFVGGGSVASPAFAALPGASFPDLAKPSMPAINCCSMPEMEPDAAAAASKAALTWRAIYKSQTYMQTMNEKK